MQSLEESIGTVQRQVRQLRLVAALLGLALLLSFIVPPRELRASRFVLVDPQGHERGVLRVSDDVPALLFQDQAGLWRAVLSVDGDVSSLNLTRAGGSSGISLSAGAGTSAVTVYGDAGKPAIELGATEAGARAVLPLEK